MGSSWKFENVSTMDIPVSVTVFWFSFGSRISLCYVFSELLIKINRISSHQIYIGLIGLMLGKQFPKYTMFTIIW